MRWILIAPALMLAACQQLQPSPEPTELPGPVPAGRPEAGIALAGDQWEPCTKKQLKQYPPVLDVPSEQYYAGPWCRDAGGGVSFMWTYAEPLFEKETPEGVREYVNEDASLLVRGLRTTGYLPVRVGERDADVFYQARRPTSPNTVIVEVLGDDPPPPGQSFSGDNPLRLLVTVRKAGPKETPAPAAP